MYHLLSHMGPIILPAAAWCNPEAVLKGHSCGASDLFRCKGSQPGGVHGGMCVCVPRGGGGSLVCLQQVCLPQYYHQMVKHLKSTIQTFSGTCIRSKRNTHQT